MKMFCPWFENGVNIMLPKVEISWGQSVFVIFFIFYVILNSEMKKGFLYGLWLVNIWENKGFNLLSQSTETLMMELECTWRQQKVFSNIRQNQVHVIRVKSFNLNYSKGK